MKAIRILIGITALWICAALAACSQQADKSQKEVAPVAAAQPAAQAGAKVQPGDKCAVDYSCRLEDGTLLITTRKEIAEDAAIAKTDLFIPLGEYRPIQMLAGIDAVNVVADEDAGLLRHLDKKLAEAIVGLETGKPSALTLEADPVSHPPGESSEARLRLVRERPIVRNMTKEYFRRVSGGQEPAPGLEVLLESAGREPARQGLMGRVESVEGDTVKVRHAVEPGDTFPTHFGPATVERFRDDGMMEIRLHPKVGQVLRLKYNLARVTKMDERAFTLDTAHPFGGERLKCEAVVLSADPDSPEKKAMQERMKGELTQLLAQGAAAQGATAQGGAGQAAQAGVVQAGDLAWVQYRITDEKGGVWRGNMAEKGAQGGATADLYPVVAGRKADLPGLDQAVVGMRPGDIKQSRLESALAFGPRLDSLVKKYERVKKVPRISTGERKALEGQFGIDARPGTLFEIPLYGQAEVTAATDSQVTFELKAAQKKMEHPYGTTTITVEGDNVAYTLAPRIGATFTDNRKTGTITAGDDTHFTVDFNHPLAGQAITLDVRVEKLRKAAELANAAIHWQEDLDLAQQEAEQGDKAVAVMLYADWCSWCKKMFNETLTDPVITSLEERFVWVKLNSDKHKEYMTRFGQKGFPMMVLLDKQGHVIEKREGFQQVYPLWESLRQVLAGGKG